MRADRDRVVCLCENRSEKGDSLGLDGCRNGIAISFGVGKTRLANFSASPVEIVAFLTNPIAGLVRDGSSVPGVQDGWLWNAYESAGSDLTLLWKGFIVRPVHDARGQRVAGDILDLATDGKGASRGCEQGMYRLCGRWRRWKGWRLGRISWGHWWRWLEARRRQCRGRRGQRCLVERGWAGARAATADTSQVASKIMCGTFRGTADPIAKSEAGTWIGWVGRKGIVIGHIFKHG